MKFQSMNKRVVMIGTALLAVFSIALGQAQKNLSLVGHLPYVDELADTWAYVDSQGHEYAIVGVQTGVSIVDLANPAQPVELQFMPGLTSRWRDIIVYQHWAYVSNEEGDGIRIIDLSTLPGTVSYKDTVMNGTSTCHNVWEENGVLFLVGNNNFGGGMTMYDIATDPWRPSFLGAYTDRYVHDVYVRNDTAYLAEVLNGRLTIVDVSDPGNPVPLGTRTYQNSFTHNTWLNDGGNVCFTTDELPSAYLSAFEVSDPSNIVLLDQIRSSLSYGEAIPHNTHVRNDYLITSYYRDGLNIVDASRPHNLVEVGYFDTSDTLEGSGYNGAWGTYPFLPSGLILVSDIEKGLFVLQPNYQRACYLEGSVVDATNNNPLSNVSIRIEEAGITDASQTNGSYAMGIVDGGTYTVSYSRLGYKTETRTVSLSPGQLTQEIVGLIPGKPMDYTLQVVDADSNQNLAGVQLRLISPDGGLIQDFISDGNGQVQINNLPETTYEVQTGLWGYVGQSFSLSPNPDTPQTIIALERGYTDDFNFDLGWTLMGTATAGLWERGEPQGTTGFDQWQINPERDLPGDIGDDAYVTGNGGGSVGFDDLDNGIISLTSPPMDLSIYNEPLLGFHWWLVNFDFQMSVPGDDFLRVELTDGLSTFVLGIFSGNQGFNNFWTLEDSIRVRDYFSLENPLQIRFVSQDEGSSNILEAAIDGFSVTEGNPPWATSLAEKSLLVEEQFRVSPNPIGEHLGLAWDLPPEWRSGEVQLEVLSLAGQSLMVHPLGQLVGKQAFDFPLSGGIYFAQLKYKGQRVAIRKFVKM
jgi:choice-of-anchor B domain-containing protein